MHNIQARAAAMKDFKIKRNYTFSQHKHSQIKKSIQKGKGKYFTQILSRREKNYNLVKSCKQTIQQKIPKSNRNSDTQILREKENKILKKLLLTKNHNKREKRWHTQIDEELYLQKTAPMNEMQSLQIQILKPTQRYFHYLSNLKLVEKILLAKPSEQVNRQSQKSFYKNQTKYKVNLKKLNYQGSKQITHKKSWID